MNDKRELLNLISNDFSVFRGDNESATDYECRLIYSMIGYMGYSALWDDFDADTDTVSIAHFKTRIEDALEAYQAVFPEIQGKYTDEISDEIYKVFLSSGYIYHSNYRIRPCVQNEIHHGGIALCRGVVPEGDLCISGLGTYYKSSVKEDSINDVMAYCSLNRPHLSEYYQLLMRNASFSDLPEIKFEYLKTQKPFTNGYWIERPDSDGVTIARSGMNGRYLYYLINNADMKEVYQLPAWMAEGGEYRAIANSIMFEKGILPVSKYIVDGSVVRLSIEYLYPNEEMNLIRLYSWPADYLDKSRDFNRIFSCDVFFMIKSLFESIGYKFIEEK